MLQRRILIVQENIQSARYTRFVLEEAGYLVDWRPAVTAALLEMESPSDAVLCDFHFVDRDELAGHRLLREHARWRNVPTLVAAGIFDRATRLLLRQLGADEVMAKPFGPQELLMRLRALLRAGAPLPVGTHHDPDVTSEPASNWELRQGHMRELAQFAASHASPEAMEATMVQALRSLRRELPFDVGYVCAEGAPARYSIVAHVGDATCNNARWYEPGMSYTGWIVLHKQPLIIPNIDKEPRVRMLGREQGGNRNFHSFVGVPLMCEGHVVGTMEVGCYLPGALDCGSLEALEEAGRVASLALCNVQARRELTMQVSRGAGSASDEVAGLPRACESAAMQAVLRVAARVRDSAVPVLLTGETGSGKEVMARYLHETGARRHQPFTAVACAAVPETFQSREMFGIEKGVAAGVDARAGRFEECGGGSLFLDEVGHMPLSLQAKLLRVLEERQFSRTGSSRMQRFAGRIIASTSTDLQAAMRAGTFLPALYHRLALIELHMPPLRTRTEDLPILADYFAERFCVESGIATRGLSPGLKRELATRSWPGNIRELKNTVERSILLSEGNDLSLPGERDTKANASAFSMRPMLAQALEQHWSIPDLQLRYSRFVYEQVGRNKARACRLLKINYRTLCQYVAPEGQASSSPGSRPN